MNELFVESHLMIRELNWFQTLLFPCCRFGIILFSGQYLFKSLSSLLGILHKYLAAVFKSFYFFFVENLFSVDPENWKSHLEEV